jgi:hypothetical protein
LGIGAGTARWATASLVAILPRSTPTVVGSSCQ